MTIVFSAMALVTIPEAARVLRRSPHRLWLFCLTVTAILLAIAVGWGAVLLIALPRGMGDLVLGPIWHHAYPLVIPTLAGIIGTAAGAGVFACLHALGAAERSLRIAIISAVVAIVCSLVGALFFGTAGAITGTAVAVWSSTILSWFQFQAALREFRSSQATSASAYVGGSSTAARAPMYQTNSMVDLSCVVIGIPGFLGDRQQSQTLSTESGVRAIRGV